MPKPPPKKPAEKPSSPEPSLQTKQPNAPARERRPKARAIGERKKRFLKVLAECGGVVTDACKASGLDRKTAYVHYHQDPEFRSGWHEALETAYDEIIREGRTRAIKGTTRTTEHPDGTKTVTTEKSDHMLVHLMKHHEVQRKWRGRMIEMGNLVLETVRKTAKGAELTEQQIMELEDALLEAFGKVSLV